MKRFWFIFLMFAMSANAFALTSGDRAQFERANRAYSQEEFSKAAELYEDLVEDGAEEAMVHFNLGNTYVRLGEMGKAILAYERARWFAPRDSDVLENLAYAKSLLEYRVEDKRNWYLKAGESVLKFFTEDEVGILAALFYFLFILGCIFALFFKQGKPWGYMRKSLLGLCLISLTLFGAKNVQTKIIRDAVVTGKEVEVRFAPSDTDQVAFRVGEGLKAYVVKQRDAWSRIMLVNGEGGWVKNTQIAEVGA